MKRRRCQTSAGSPPYDRESNRILALGREGINLKETTATVQHRQWNEHLRIGGLFRRLLLAASFVESSDETMNPISAWQIASRIVFALRWPERAVHRSRSAELPHCTYLFIDRGTHTFQLVWMMPPLLSGFVARLSESSGTTIRSTLAVLRCARRLSPSTRSLFLLHSDRRSRCRQHHSHSEPGFILPRAVRQ